MSERADALVAAVRTVVHSVDTDAREAAAMRYPFWLASALVDLRAALYDYDEQQREATPSGHGPSRGENGCPL